MGNRRVGTIDYTGQTVGCYTVGDLISGEGKSAVYQATCTVCGTSKPLSYPTLNRYRTAVPARCAVCCNKGKGMTVTRWEDRGEAEERIQRIQAGRVVIEPYWEKPGYVDHL